MTTEHLVRHFIGDDGPARKQAAKRVIEDLLTDFGTIGLQIILLEIADEKIAEDKIGDFWKMFRSAAELL